MPVAVTIFVQVVYEDYPLPHSGLEPKQKGTKQFLQTGKSEKYLCHLHICPHQHFLAVGYVTILGLSAQFVLTSCTDNTDGLETVVFEVGGFLITVDIFSLPQYQSESWKLIFS